ncbi:MAG: hypothetical protein P1V36_03665 [Planctomycetota bacterium]|nr:hypothetical protein [Planctomycetota bacterium]
MQDINIQWRTAETISKVAKAVVSGDEASEETETVSREPVLKWTDKPLLVFICDEASGCEAFDKIEELVLKDEKIALGMKAFRTVKMHPEHAAADPLLKDQGKGVPRMVFVNPAKMNFHVLEPKKVKPSALYSMMKRTAKGYWKESLDKVVKGHLKLLVQQDKLANQLKTLEAKKARVEEKDDEKKLGSIAKEIAQVEEDRKALRAKKAELWKLTPKKTA